MVLALRPDSGAHLSTAKTIDSTLQFTKPVCGEPMTEPLNESSTSDKDQLAHYRLKLEETAALVARIRHEINNPLTGVLGQAQLLLREDLSERSRKRVQTIEDLALRLRDVVAQLRDVQKPGGESE